MITQALKRWLHKICRWWSWKRTPESAGSQVVAKTSVATMQDTGWCTTLVDGPEPQTGVMSVVFEQEKDAPLPDTTRSTTEASLERLVPPTKAENSDALCLSLTELSQSASLSPNDALSRPVPTFEQQLAFLQYLMRQGIINEGFAEGQVPRQYRHKL